MAWQPVSPHLSCSVPLSPPLRRLERPPTPPSVSFLHTCHARGRSVRPLSSSARHVSKLAPAPSASVSVWFFRLARCASCRSGKMSCVRGNERRGSRHCARARPLRLVTSLRQGALLCPCALVGRQERASESCRRPVSPSPRASPPSSAKPCSARARGAGRWPRESGACSAERTTESRSPSAGACDAIVSAAVSLAHSGCQWPGRLARSRRFDYRIATLWSTSNELQLKTPAEDSWHPGVGRDCAGRGACPCGGGAVPRRRARPSAVASRTVLASRVRTGSSCW